MELTATPYDFETTPIPNGGRRMLGTIIRKEIRGNLRGIKFPVIFLLLATLIATSLFVMYRDYRLRLENYEVLRPQPTQAVAIVPPNPLGIFVKRLDESMGVVCDVNACFDFHDRSSFLFLDMPLGKRCVFALPSMGTLALFNLIFFIVVYIRFVRCDSR